MGALDFRPIPVPIGRLNQSSPRDNAIAGELLIAENYYVASGNAGGLELSKREGCQAMPRDVYGPSGALSFLFGATGLNVSGVPLQYYPINGTGGPVTSSPGFKPPPGTATLLTINVAVGTNGFDTAATFSIYKNGVDTGISRSVPAGADGIWVTSPFSVSFSGSDVLDLVLIGTHESTAQSMTFQATVAFTAVAPVDISDGLRLGTLDQALVLRARQTIYSWLPHANAWKDHGAGLRPAVSVDSRTAVADEFIKVWPTMAVGGGLELVAWNDDNGLSTVLRYSVRDTVSGTMVVENSVLVAANVLAKAVYSDGRFCIFYKGTNQHLQVALILPASPASSTVVDLGAMNSGGAFASRFDVQATDDDRVAYAFVETGGSATSFTKGFFDPSAGTTANVGSVDLGASNILIGLAWLTQTPWTSSPRQYWLAVVVDGGVGHRDIYSIVFSSTLGSPSATLRHSYTGTWPGGNVAGYHDAAATGGAVIFFDNLKTPAIDNRIDLPGGAALARSLRLLSRAFSVSGRWYVLTFYDSGIQPTFFLLDVTTGAGHVVAKALSGIASNRVGDFALPWTITNGVTVAMPTASEAFINVCTFNFAGSDLSQPRQLSNGSLHFPGAIPMEFDGAAVNESGFLVFPEAPTLLAQDLGGNVTPGVHSVRVVYMRVDARGNIHRSAPSVPAQITVTAPDDTIQVTVPTLRVTMTTNVFVEVYATTSSDPDVYYRAFTGTKRSPYDPDNPSGASDTVTASIGLNASDDELAANEQLYTGPPLQPGELEHIAPPPCRIVATHNSRLFYAGVDTDPGAVWMSAQAVPGNGVAFNDALVFRVDGAATAMASSGVNYLEIFTADRIWIVSGAFPDATGGGVAIPEPFRLDHEVGALSSGSVVVASNGTYFKSKKGIWVLGGGLGVDPVSDPLADLRQSVGDVSTIEITAGLVATARQHVRFYTNASKTYVWDSEWKTWAISTGAAMSAVDALIWNGLPTHLQADGTVRQEGPATYFDDAGVFVPSRAKIAMLNLAGIRGYVNTMEVQVIGRYRQAVDVTARLYLDGSETAENPFTFSIPLSGPDPVLFAVRPKKRRCSSVAIDIVDSIASGVSPGMTIEAVTLLVGVNPKLARLPAAKRTARTP